MTKVAIIGAGGRMGQMLIRCAHESDSIETVAATEQPGNASLGKDAGVVAGIDEIGVMITDDAGAVSAADVIIDFTFHTATPENVKLAVEMKKAIIAAKPVLPKYKPFGELVPYVGETIEQLNNGKHLVLNVAPEGCMVASMGEMLGPKIMQFVDNSAARIQYLSTTECEINEDLMKLSLLKTLGSEKYYSE